MEEDTFFNNLGFDSNPFQYTNADDEDRLEQYFIPPPYFNSVWGNPKKPKSATIFAPRGGGKTAQRRMIEIKSQNERNVLCVTYSIFDFQKQSKEIVLDDHLNKIIPIIIMGILTKFSVDPEVISNLDKKDKKYLKRLIDTHLGTMSEYEFKNSIDSLSSYSDKAKKIWNDNLGSINIAISLILSRLGANAVEFKKNEEIQKFDETLRYQLDVIRQIVTKIGYESTYILVDKVDESEITGNDASKASKLIEPLLKDLNLLEMRGYGFKFFLWDNLQRYYEEYGRKDRVEYYSLDWKNSDLKMMLSKRLDAFSNGKVGNLSDIVEQHFDTDINDLILLFAQKSPRNVIRIIQDIISEQREMDTDVKELSHQAVLNGIDVFCKKRVTEIVDRNSLKDLTKIGKCEFTIKDLATNVFRCNEATIRTKIKKWNDLGLINQVGKIKKEDNNKPVNRYCIDDLIVARNVFEKLPLEQFLESKCNICPNCGVYLLRDWEISNSSTCQYCSIEVEHNKRSINGILLKDSKSVRKIDADKQKKLIDF